MALHSHSAIRNDYPSCAHPPQKKHPVKPLPLPPSSPSPSSSLAQTTRRRRRRSGTFSAIASWAAHVQPGSPASLSPHPPHRRHSLCKDRRPSVASLFVPSASFLHIAPTPTTAFAPTPSIRDFKPDLTTVGYTSVFLHLPNTPNPACLKPPSPNNFTHPPTPSSTCKPRGIPRLRSLSALRLRGRSKSACPNSPTKMRARAAAAVKRKKAKYTMHPLPLANDLALMQFVGGGNMDDNIKRAMKAQAKASDATGLADVYRDGEGGIWWDQDEEWEYAHLLAEDDESRPYATGDIRWVTFGGNTSPLTAGLPGEDRRGSVSTQDSDLDPKYVVQPADSLHADDLAIVGSALTTSRPPASDLRLPSRPHHTGPHLRKPDFLVDMAFSRPHASPRSPRLATLNRINPKGRARRRPAPLNLSPPSPAFKRPTNSPIDADKVRRDFIDASFDPVGLVPTAPGSVTPATAESATTPMEACPRLVGNSHAINVPWQSVGMKNKPSMLNMMGLFRSARKEDKA